MKKFISIALSCALLFNVNFALASTDTEQVRPSVELSHPYDGLVLFDEQITLKSNKTSEISLTLPEGGHVEYVESDYKRNDFSYLIYDKNNELIAFTENINADDENLYIDSNIIDNKIVNTYVNSGWTNINDVNTVVYSVKDKPFSYWFFSGKWANRGGKYPITLMLQHAGTIRTAGRTAAAWNRVVEKFSGDSNWFNEDGLEKQFRCHAQYAGIAKAFWNIEPQRPNWNYPSTVASYCNPGSV